MNNGTPHLKSPKNENRRAAFGRPAKQLLGGGEASTSLRSNNPGGFCFQDTEACKIGVIRYGLPVGGDFIVVYKKPGIPSQVIIHPISPKTALYPQKTSFSDPNSLMQTVA